MKEFLSEIADKLLTKQSKKIQDITIVLPSKRSIVFFKHYLSQKIDKPIWLPKIISIEDFVVSISGLDVIDNLSLQFRLFQIVKESTPSQEKETLEQFLKWSQTVINDYNEIDRYLVDPDSVFNNLQEIKEIEQWSLGQEDLTDFQKKYIAFFQNLGIWYQNLKESLLEEGLAYQGLAYRIASEKIKDKEIMNSEFWFVGLNALTNAEKKIVDCLLLQDKAKLFWDADSYYVNNHKNEAGLFLRQHFEKWGESNCSSFFEQKKNIQVIGAARSLGQCKIAGHVLEDLISQNSELKSQETALVLADEQLLFPMLNNLPENLDSVNITMGMPLRTAPLFSLVDLLFKTHIQKEFFKKDKFYFKDLQKLFRNPYLNKIISTEITQALNKKLVSKNAVFVSLSELKNFSDSSSVEWKTLEYLLSDWDDTMKILNIIQQLFDSLKEQLVDEKANVDAEILFVFRKSVTILENHLSILDDEIDLKTLKSIFFQLLGKESTPFRGEPLNGLQMMGVLETRTLDFKNVVLMSVNEDKLPAGKSVNSFIPFVLKKHFSMPTHVEKDAIFAYHFYRLIQRAENVYLIYNTQNDGLSGGEKSRFITQLQNELKHSVIEEKFLELKSPSGSENDIIIPKSKDVMERLQQWSNKRVSPTALNSYINCSLQFYFKYIAKIYKEDEIDEHIEANVFGEFIHDSLENSYGKFKDKALTDQMLDEIQVDALSLLKSYFFKKVGQRLCNGKNYVIWQVAIQMIQDFIQQEKKLVQLQLKSKQTLIVRELERELNFKINCEGMSFHLNGKVDRIDEIGGERRIVDYKTGLVVDSELAFTNFKDLKDKKSKSKAFQLMVYAYLYFKDQKNVEAVFTAGNLSFRNMKNGMIPIRLGKSNSPALELNDQSMQFFEDVLMDLFKEMKNDSIPFAQTEDVSKCTYCDFKTICARNDS